MTKPPRIFDRVPDYSEFIRHFIPETIKVLGRARPVDLERCFRKTFGQDITDDTLRKYADLLVEEGVLRKEVAVDNRDGPLPPRRRYRMVWYLLKK